MHPQILPIVPHGLIRQLIDIHIKVPIRPDTRAIRPDNTRVSDVAVRLQVARVVVVDSIMLRYELVHQPIRVPLKAIPVPTALAQTADVIVRRLVGERVAVAFAQVRGGHRVEHVAGERGVVDGVAVGRDLDPVEPFLQVADGAAERLLVEGVALVGGHVLVHAQHGVVLREASPGFAGGEIEHDEAGPALVAAVDDVGDALSAGRDVRSKIWR